MSILPPEQMSTSERWAEIVVLLAAAVQRAGNVTQRPLGVDFTAPRSVHVSPKRPEVDHAE